MGKFQVARGYLTVVFSYLNFKLTFDLVESVDFCVFKTVICFRFEWQLNGN